MSVINYNNLVLDEKNDKISKNTLLYPIVKAFFEDHHDYDDIVRTYDNALENIPKIIGEDRIIDENILTADKQTYINFKLKFVNVKINPPNSDISHHYSNIGWIPTPNIALSKMSTYAVTVTSDAHLELYSFKESTIDKKQELLNITIENCYNFTFPIPVYSKYCTLRNFDYMTLLRSGEEMEAMYGYFIIEGKLRFLIPIFKKPFNSPLIMKNDYENQLSRTDVLYTKGFEYEDSYYIVASIIRDKPKSVGRGGTTVSPPDFIFSLQISDKMINSDVSTNGIIKKNKRLFNVVPIRYLFYAFGCTNDKEMLEFICPSMDDFALIHSIRNACLQGFKHKEALEIANIPKNTDSNIIKLTVPLDMDLARYIIGSIILTPEIKEKLLTKNKDLYQTNIIWLVTKLLTEKFMPGIGDNSDIDRNKAVCIEMGLIVRRLYLVGYNLEPSQDKISLSNRRLRIGNQIEREFKAFHTARLRDDCMVEIRRMITEERNQQTIVKNIKNNLKGVFLRMSTNIGNSLINSFKEANPQSKIRTGVITPKNINFIHGSLRELVISTEIKGTTVTWAHRDVHQSEMFFIDPTQTPEAGDKTGRFRMPALFTFITLGTRAEKEREYICKHKYYIKDIFNNDKRVKYSIADLYYIKINGSVSGYVKKFDEVETMYSDLLMSRQNNIIGNETTIVLNHSLGTLNIWTDIGRLITYFICVKTCFNIKNSMITCSDGFKKWLEECSSKIHMLNNGVTNGFLTLMDSDMCCENAIVAPSMKEFYVNPTLYTHIALPNALHGIVSGMVPGINMCKGVRSALITNHTKQAIGPNIRYPQLKYMNDSSILISPQIPLAHTCIYDYKKVTETPYGQNVVVAFMIYKYNQEDSIIVNKASIESGNFLEMDSMFTIISEIEQDKEFAVPENCTLNGNLDSYNKLNPKTSLPRKVGEIFYQTDAIIGKVLKTDTGISDISILNDRPDGKYPRGANMRTIRNIVKNYIHDNDKGVKVAQFGQFCTAIVGDKVNSECAQKGTIGSIMSPGDMPYTQFGLRPDVIFNPPSIFKRETYSQIYLAMLQKICSLYGCAIDCTPYHTQRSTEELQELAHSLGINDQGKEILYDPDTGRQYRAHIFVANHYWERQPHLVEKKINVRNGGVRDKITFMPTRGKKRGGGQSIDRMGMDSMFSSGINSLKMDELLNRGSKIKIAICNHCHSMKTYLNKDSKSWFCTQCGSHPDFTVKYVPHASNLLNHIFNSLHISIDYYTHGSTDL